MKKGVFVAVILLAAFLLPAPASAAPIWYQVTFTGADVWTYSADNAAEARHDQSAPRRYATYNNAATGAPDGTGPRVLQDTTYGLLGGLAGTGFGAWAPTSGFAFDSLNLWGAGGTGDWNETYTSVGNSDPGAQGVSSWKVLQSPTGWTSGIVKGGDSWSADATHAFPVWRSGTGATLGIANMNDPSFVFTFEVLADSAALDSSGKLRVFFGGFRDDLQGTGPDNYEVSGVMTLTATQVPVPEPGSMLLFGSGLVGLTASLRKRLRK